MTKVQRMLCTLLLSAGAGRIACGAEIGFIEDFALTEDRAVALKQLIPGTEDFYYYQCLNNLNAGQFEKLPELMKLWRDRHGETQRYYEIQNREALLKYEKNPAPSLEFIRWRLGVNFNHQKELRDQKPNLPTQFDNARITRDALALEMFGRFGNNLQGFEDSALDWVALAGGKLPNGQALDGNRRRELLQRLARPDYPALVELVAADLKYQYSGGFGSLTIHRQMLLDQLDDLLKRQPELKNNSNFVMTYISRLRPGMDADWKRDVKTREAYLDRLAAYVKTLPQAFNSLKAHVLYQRLVSDQSQGIYNKERLLEYLAIPRSVPYMNPKYLEQAGRANNQAYLGQDFHVQTLFPVIGNDEPLVRDYLLNIFVKDEDFKVFEPLIVDSYLKPLFAEAKIVNNIGDMEKWYSLLNDPTRYQQLKDRVDLEFSPANKQFYAADDAVGLDIDVKNVKTLFIKVYEINTANYYRQNQKEVSTDINLDGLVPNEEKTVTYDDAPLTRVRRHFDFPNLKKAGVYVVDFIGNGTSSRALIRKGQLRFLETKGGAGHNFIVLDENNKRVKEPSLWIAGHEYKPDAEGLITVPYSNQPNQVSIVLADGATGLNSLDSFKQLSENYRLSAGFYVDREALVKRNKTNVVIRPMLYVNDQPISLKNLEEVTLTITSMDRDGVSTSKEVPTFDLKETSEATYEFQVPENLIQLSFSLKAKIQNLAQNKKVDLSDSNTFPLNKIEQVENIETLHLSRVDGAFVLRLLGKNGDPHADRPINVSLKHKDFKEQIQLSLETDKDGRAVLGALKDISQITASGPDGVQQFWFPSTDSHAYPGTLSGKAGEVVSIPYMGKAAKPDRAEFSLYETRNGQPVKDYFDALTLQDGFVQLNKLPAGNYDLFIKDTNTRMQIVLAEGEEREGYALGQNRILQEKDRSPLQIVSYDVNADTVKINLKNADKFTRVHVTATRFFPAYTIHGSLGSHTFPGIVMQNLEPEESFFLSGRNIGDEYRYILERKYAKKYAGNMLTRPTLLLNPWALRNTDLDTDKGSGHGSFGQRGGGGRKLLVARHGGSRATVSQTAGYANLDFLADPGVLLFNLKPDDKGVVTIARKDLGANTQIRVFGVEPETDVYREFALPEVPILTQDLRLKNALDPVKHYTEQKKITVVDAGKPFSMEDITTSQLEVYDSIGRVYALFSTLNGDATFNEFNFIAKWPTLKLEEKREKYSKYACHELSFFLSRKDPDFFKGVIQPYLKNKKDKTFMDHYLLGNDLGAFLKPWAYERLNVVERILLAQRIQAERDPAGRYVKEAFDLIPPDVERYNYLFRTAIKGSALETSGGLGLQEAAKAAENRKQEMEQQGQRANAFGLATNAPSPAAPPPAATAAPLMALAEAPEKSQGFKEAGAAKNEEAMDRAAEAKPAAKMRAARADEKSKKALADGEQDEQLGADKDGKDAPGAAGKRDGLYYADDSKRREAARQLYKKIDQTQEWAENNYWHKPIEEHNTQLVTVNPFWNDFAVYMAQGGNGPFYSKYLADASHNFTEMVLALSVLDLPFDAAKPETKFQNTQMTLNSKTALVAYHKEVKETPAAENAAQSPILVTQNFFRLNDRYRYEDNQQYDKYVTGEFLSNVAYGCQIVLTNPTSAPRKLDLLLQVPKGAIPVRNGFYTKGVYIQLGAYSTTTFEYAFYFPTAGNYSHYPVHVSQNEKWIVAAPAVALNVVDKPTKLDTESWDYISQDGSQDDVMKYLNTHNLQRIDLEKIAWRMPDVNNFKQVTNFLGSHHVYQNTLWSYGLKHNDPEVAREFLKHQESFLDQCGMYLDSALIKIDPVDRWRYQHLEYSPLVNARAHRFGKDNKILNDRFFQQYQNWMKYLTYKPKLDDTDRLAVAYYLLLQDRVEEGLAQFQRVNPQNVATNLQYDYMKTYVDFYTDDHKLARGIADNYKDYPVDRWRNLFRNVITQLDEQGGKAGDIVDKENRDQQQAKLAATEANFDFRVEAKKVSLNYQNLSDVQVNYYLMDIELLFSVNPFVQQYSGSFAFIRPNKSDALKLAADKKTMEFDLPAEFQNANVMVEIVAGGQRKTQAYYANSLQAQVVENYGQLKITHTKTGQPLSKVYVKVYEKTRNGEVKFYKDGYTDLRGRFEYSSLSTNDLDNVDRFSLLVLSDTDGALIREAMPPKQ